MINGGVLLKGFALQEKKVIEEVDEQMEQESDTPPI
jgi:hypothetical protein